MKMRCVTVLMALLMMSMITSQPATAQDLGYIDCMDRAIDHKYEQIASGSSYSDAHEHYLWHTARCLEYYYPTY